MKRYDYMDLANGRRVKREKNLEKSLNLNILRITNKTHSVGPCDLPALSCHMHILPDYIALYNHPADYRHTANTAVAFFLYDDTFDGKDGLFNAIYYHDIERLAFFKARFLGIKTFIMPDLSLCGDVPVVENCYRLFKMRVISLWLTMELDAVVIPLVSFWTAQSIEFALEGYKDCSVVCFSTKGSVGNPTERRLLKEAVKVTVDTLSLTDVVVFDVCGDDENTHDIFSYAAEKGVHVHIPANMLKDRNIQRRYPLNAY